MKNLWKRLGVLLLMLDGFFKGGADRVTPRRKQTRYTYSDGPMVYLGQQIVRLMQDAGYPAKIYEAYRPPERQTALYVQNKTKAKAYQSPHQYYLAVDIIHASRGWPPKDDPFWPALAASVQVVEEKFDVALTHGYDWGWDYAHVELTDFRKWRDVIGQQPITSEMLDLMFATELPKVWKAYKARKGA